MAFTDDQTVFAGERSFTVARRIAFGFFGVVIGAVVLSFGWAAVQVPFTPNATRFNAAADYVLSARPVAGAWDLEVKLPLRFAWLTKGYAVAVFKHGGHELLFFPQFEEPADSYDGYFFSVDGASPGTMLTGAEPVAAHWWRGSLSAQFLAGG